jgi:agmatine deiminase
MKNSYTLLPEWSPQEAVLLVWPDQHTDWQPWLTEVQEVYLQIIAALNQTHTAVVLLVRDIAVVSCKNILPKLAKVLLVKADYNDTWIRDYGFLTCSNQGSKQPVEFIFNGWGNKFDGTKDNKINQQVLSQLCQLPIKKIDLVLEGGAIEIDEQGTLLSTKLCLTNTQRNGNKSLAEYQHDLQHYLGANKTIILGNGHLQGDDTDGHIDTLVRFSPVNAIVVQSAFNRPTDSHFKSLQALVNECRECLPDHKIFELPLPYVLNTQGERLPASYANYLITNQQVLCPIYLQEEDDIALEIIQKAYPEHKIVAINCLPLVQQFGSLHCISMQIPCGTLKSEVLQSLANGVKEYE